MKIVSVGEILWDVFPDGERLGGAPFNFSVHASRLGHDVAFVSAVGDDARGRLALARIRELGLSTEFVRVVTNAPTGFVTVTLRDGEPDYVIHRPAAYQFLEVPEVAADWIYYGTLANCGRAFLRMDAPRFYDVNLRRDSYSRELVEELMHAADVVKLNESELDYMGRRLHELAAISNSTLAASPSASADAPCWWPMITPRSPRIQWNLSMQSARAMHSRPDFCTG